MILLKEANRSDRLLLIKSDVSLNEAFESCRVGHTFSTLQPCISGERQAFSSIDTANARLTKIIDLSYF